LNNNCLGVRVSPHWNLPLTPVKSLYPILVQAALLVAVLTLQVAPYAASGVKSAPAAQTGVEPTRGSPPQHTVPTMRQMDAVRDIWSDLAEQSPDGLHDGLSACLAVEAAHRPQVHDTVVPPMLLQIAGLTSLHP
jgi:hypothetical protein